jgi:hypothetical protein
MSVEKAFRRRTAHIFAIVFLAASLLCESAAAGELVEFSASGDYGGSSPFSETEIASSVPAGVNPSWFPLSFLKKYLPLAYSENRSANMVTLSNSDAAEAGSLTATRTFQLGGRWKSCVCRCGSEIYISPSLVDSLFSDRLLNIMDGKLYLPVRSGKASGFISDGGDADFSLRIDASLYALWKKAPSDYSFTVSELGCIARCADDDQYRGQGAAYVYTGRNTCYVLDSSLPPLKLASVLAHEAGHVAFYRSYSGLQSEYFAASEASASAYGSAVYRRLLAVQ